MPIKTKRPIRLFSSIFLGLTGLLLIILGLGLWPYKDAIWVQTKNWQQLKNTVVPYLQVYQPEEKGPFPVVLVIPGCEGVYPDRTQSRVDWLTDQGYMAVVVDSHTGRGLDKDVVCGGYALWGAERAGDVYVALDYVRQLPNADHDRIALLGYSHGGWTIFDTFSYNGQTPYALESIPDNLLSLVKAAVTYYPYCDIPSRARLTYNSSIPLLTLNAGQDKTVDAESCEVLLRSWKDQELPVTTITYPDVDHGFDVSNHKNYSPVVHQQALQQVAQFLKKNLTTKSQ